MEELSLDICLATDFEFQGPEAIWNQQELGIDIELQRCAVEVVGAAYRGR